MHTQQLQPGTYEVVEKDAYVVQTDPFYVPLACAGNKSIVVDLCVDRPRPIADLVQVIDWATEFKLYHYCTTPRSTQRFVDRVCPDHPLTRYGGTDPSEANLLQLNQKLLRGAALKGKLVRRLMDANPDWSFLFAGFCEIHKAGHFFWQYQDPSHPQYAGINHPLSPALDALYERFDEQMMEISKKAGSDTNIIVVADRGMRSNFRGDHLVQRMLIRLGLLVLRDATSTLTTGDATGERLEIPDWQRRLKNRIPVALRPTLRRLLGKEVTDWHRTKVFRIPDVGNSYLRINLAGREPFGVVSQIEYDDLLADLEREFTSLVDPATGRCPVREVVFPQRTAAGPLSENLPDFGVIWEYDSPITALESSSLGRIEGANVEQRSGNHTERGGMLVSGPDFSAGLERDGDLRELAPTLLALYNVAAPSSYEFPAVRELKRASES